MHSHHRRHWSEGQLHHQWRFMSYHRKFNHGGELMLRNLQTTSTQIMDERPQQQRWVTHGHATSITVNRQKVKEHICQSDWRGICVADASLHEEESDDQYRRDVADSFNIFDEINAPAVQASEDPITSFEARQPTQAQSPQEPSKAE
eukprot:4995521-Amphidinium_carterae.1